MFEDVNTFLSSRRENHGDNVDLFNPFSLGKHNCADKLLAQAVTFAVVARICTESELSVGCEGTVNYS